jgi:hypothetical protein
MPGCGCCWVQMLLAGAIVQQPDSANRQLAQPAGNHQAEKQQGCYPEQAWQRHPGANAMCFEQLCGAVLLA